MITPDQCRAARILAALSAAQLAERAGIGLATIKRFEAGQAVQAATVSAIFVALTQAGVVFINDGEASAGGGAGVRLASS